jgi:hypothetical protein
MTNTPREEKNHKPICMTCYLHTGFMHELKPYNQHTHKDGKIIFRLPLEERVKAELDDDFEQYEYKYYGITPFHAEGLTITRAISSRIKKGIA